MIVDASVGEVVRAGNPCGGGPSIGATVPMSCMPAFFFDLEIANILWKKIRRAEISLC